MALGAARKFCANFTHRKLSGQFWPNILVLVCFLGGYCSAGVIAAWVYSVMGSRSAFSASASDFWPEKSLA